MFLIFYFLIIIIYFISTVFLLCYDFNENKKDNSFYSFQFITLNVFHVFFNIFSN